MSIKTHQGSCHCGTIRFQADLDLEAGVTECNCSACTKLAYTAARCKPDQLRVTAGEDKLSSYEWGGKIMQRYFCPSCGSHLFGKGFLEQMGGAFVSVNVRTLDDVDQATLKVRYFDGRHNNWMAGLRDQPWPHAAAQA